MTHDEQIYLTELLKEDRKRLSEWEKNFMEGLENNFNRYKRETTVTDKMWKKLEEIEKKIHALT